MIRARVSDRVPGALAVTLVAGGCMAPSAEEALAELSCSDVESARTEHYRIGDAPIIHGFVVSGGGVPGFRSCDSSDTYFIQAPLAVWDALESGSAMDVSGGAAYVRFHGVELECASEIPEPYVGGGRIEEILTAGSVPPANCK